MIRSFLGKGFGVGLCVLQYGCIAHCFVEHIAELVVVSLFAIKILKKYTY
jgi:hypothetical protein